MLSKAINFLVKKLQDINTPKKKVSEPPTVRISDTATVMESTFGKHNSIGSFCFLFKTSLQDFSYLSSHVTVMNTHIGKYCSIAQGVGIGMGDHPTKDFVSTHPSFFSPYNQCGYSFTNEESYFPELGKFPNEIGNDVWIGTNSLILNNIKVGDGAIIGAGSIVTKDVPPYAIVVGSPAKIIRYRFEPDEIEFLLKFQWWDKEAEWVEAHFKDFHNIKEFIKKYKD